MESDWLDWQINVYCHNQNSHKNDLWILLLLSLLYLFVNIAVTSWWGWFCRLTARALCCWWTCCHCHWYLYAGPVVRYAHLTHMHTVHKCLYMHMYCMMYTCTDCSIDLTPGSTYLYIVHVHVYWNATNMHTSTENNFLPRFIYLTRTSECIKYKHVLVLAVTMVHTYTLYNMHTRSYTNTL